METQVLFDPLPTWVVSDPYSSTSGSLTTGSFENYPDLSYDFTGVEHYNSSYLNPTADKTVTPELPVLTPNTDFLSSSSDDTGEGLFGSSCSSPFIKPNSCPAPFPSLANQKLSVNWSSQAHHDTHGSFFGDDLDVGQSSGGPFITYDTSAPGANLSSLAPPKTAKPYLHGPDHQLSQASATNDNASLAVSTPASVSHQSAAHDATTDRPTRSRASKSPKTSPSKPALTSSTIKSSPTATSNKSSSSSLTKVQSPTTKPHAVKQFHIISNDDKRTASRVRNTIISRAHSASKVARIAELEKLLAELEREKDTWKGRAVDLGWVG